VSGFQGNRQQHQRDDPLELVGAQLLGGQPSTQGRARGGCQCGCDKQRRAQIGYLNMREKSRHRRKDHHKGGARRGPFGLQASSHQGRNDDVAATDTQQATDESRDGPHRQPEHQTALHGAAHGTWLWPIEHHHQAGEEQEGDKKPEQQIAIQPSAELHTERRGNDSDHQHRYHHAPFDQALADEGGRGNCHGDRVEQQSRCHGAMQLDPEGEKYRNQDESRTDAGHREDRGQYKRDDCCDGNHEEYCPSNCCCARVRSNLVWLLTAVACPG